MTTLAPSPADRGFVGPLGVSLAAHLAVLILFSLLGFIPGGRTVYAPSYVVDLVSLPPSPSAPADKPAAQAAPPPPPPSAASPEKSPEADLKRAPRPDPLVLPVKPSSPDREELAALDRQRKRAELEKAIAAQEKKLASANLRAALPSALPRLAPLRPVAGPQGAATPAQAVNVDLRLKAYYDRVWEKIRSSWNLPAGVGADDRTLLAVVGIRILPAGQVEKVWLEKGSGNIYYDQSAIRAAQKASPLPPLPADYTGGPLEVGVNFRPAE